MTTPFPFVAAQVLTANELNSITNLPSSTKTANYVLTIANAGARVLMNAAGSTTITANTSIFSAGDVVELSNIGAGVCTVTAGTATVSSAGPLAIPQYGGGRLVFTSASAAIYFPSAVTVAAPAAAGLTLVTTATLSGTGFTLSNCFSATYQHYLFFINNMSTALAAGQVRVRLGTGTAHDYNSLYTSIGANWLTSTSATGGNYFELQFGAIDTYAQIWFNSPFLTVATNFWSMSQTIGGQSIETTGMETSSTSFTDVTFSNANSRAWSGGTVKVYGYSA